MSPYAVTVFVIVLPLLVYLLLVAVLRVGK